VHVKRDGVLRQRNPIPKDMQRAVVIGVGEKRKSALVVPDLANCLAVEPHRLVRAVREVEVILEESRRAQRAENEEVVSSFLGAKLGGSYNPPVAPPSPNPTSPTLGNLARGNPR